MTVGALINERYEVVRALKSGGMGAVYEARDLRLANSSCAVKEILEAVVGGPDAEYVEEKFKAEVEALATLDHPGIPKVRDFFRLEESLYIVMEFVAGSSLDDELAESLRVTGRPLEPDVVAGDALQVLEILVYLHGRQMLHRDLKPSNLVRDRATGRVKMVDFGLARTYGDQQLMTMVGTPGYSAPEQLSGRAEPRSDLYSLGVTMHHLLTGLVPKMLDLAPLEQHMPDYRPGLAAIIDKATRPKLGERYENAETMLAALRDWCRVEQLRRAASFLPTARKTPNHLVFNQAPATAVVGAQPAIPAWLQGGVLVALGLGLGLVLGTRPPTPQAATPSASPPAPVNRVAVAHPPVPVPSPTGTSLRQPDYDLRRPTLLAGPPRPASTPTPARPTISRPAPPRPTPVALVPSQPAYPVAVKRPKPQPTPAPEPSLAPLLPIRPALAGLPPMQPDFQKPLLLPLEENLVINLPPELTLDFNGMTGIIHPSGPGRGRGMRSRLQIRANVRCMEADGPQQQALEGALAVLRERIPGGVPMTGLGPDQRGLMASHGPVGMFGLVKSQPRGERTRLCIVDGGGNREGLDAVRQISRGVRFR